MARIREVKLCIALLTMLIASTASIPVAGSGELSVDQPVESREDMMIRYRLPNDTIPRLYSITIEPNMDDERLTWIGETSIIIEVLKPTSVLTLHAYKNLVIDENFTKLVDANGTILKPIEHSRDAEVEFLRVRFGREISIGNYSIDFKYTGEEAEGFVGFYKASLDSEMSPIAGTHFEATTARRAFPCWDEPSFKAHFRMSIKHYPNYTAVSNMPEIESVPSTNGKILTTFDTTLPMSTYLLTFVIADYGNISNEHGNVTVWGMKESLENYKHVLDVSPKIVEVMENYTGLSFGCPRIGSVTLPIYSAAATEHWCLVTYRDMFLGYNRTSDGYLHKSRADALMAHELTHSWFGNRVSPVWWDDLWLNEAFAAYFQNYIMEQISDTWHATEIFVMNNNHALAFPLDDPTVRPIRWTPITNREIRYVFGPVTYRKGAAILHMFRNVLGDDVCRAGIKKYLVKHSFGSATADDLMRALQEAYDEGPNGKTPLSVKETMTSWLVQSGHPTLNVIRNYTTGVTTVIQESPSAYADNGTLINSTSKWWIPLTYTTQTDLNFSSTMPRSWMSDKEDSVTIDGIGKDDWVIFNVQWSGFYRVKYDEENMNRIVAYLNTDNYKNIHVLNRAQLISHASHLVDIALEQHIGDFYKVAKYLTREVEYPPWRAAKNVILRLDMILSSTEVHEIFLRYIVGLMNALVEKVGFEDRENDDLLTLYARSEFVEWACASGHSGCSEYAAEELVKFVKNQTNDRLYHITKSEILCAGLRGLNATTAKQVVEWALDYSDGMLMGNLGCTKNHEIHRDFLRYILKSNFTNASLNMRLALSSIAERGEENFNFAVDFIIQNPEEMKNLTTTSPNGKEDNLLDLIHMITPEVRSASRLEKFKQILQMDAVLGDNRIDTKSLLETAEETAARGTEIATKFRNFWDKHVSADNTINSEHPESR